MVSVVLSLRHWLNMPVDDETLMQRYAQTGDARLLSALYDRRADDLYHFLLALCGHDMAQDVAQKTWLKVIEKRRLFNGSGRFKGWLFTLGRHTLLDDLRKRSGHPSSQAEVSAGCEFCDVDNQLAEAFGAALNALPFEQREAFCLQQEGFGLQEIATMCDCGTETIKSRLRYARHTLRQRLEKYHD
ncbi:sigma-70 family RNA polymerase sigma factor [Alteromonas sp. CYL-A6]|uniref:sigma-70 family RNA polymerase sigma factor n=1 Tax=Alteromonas nitratireducens TaxID=3390813 RepID=UPI0034B96C3C